ncbi:MAG TPA: DUF4965 domain-containing protein [Sphingobacterium bovisgrunnientis]|nr:DUF4965 domain-containing protein [Sphingobacterium bovisgrunnientis]
MYRFFPNPIGIKHTKKSVISFAFASVLTLMSIFNLQAQKRVAPAYPLITHNPNFSIWSMTDQLHASTTKHWTDADHSLLGLINVDGVIYRFMGLEAPNYKSILNTAEEKSFEVHYTEQTPVGNWTAESYDTHNWKQGAAPIGDNGDVKTQWKSDNIWVRRVFDIASLESINELILKLNHDDNIELYLNGKYVYNKNGWTNKFDYIKLNKADLKKGKNIIAIHLKNTAGGRYLDFGLVDKIQSKDSKILEAVQKNVEVTATRTIYTFQAGKVDLKVTFTSPLLMDDLALLARPVSYITYSVKANNNKKHNVNVFFAASSDIAVYRPSQKVVATQYAKEQLSILKVGTVEQPILAKGADDMRIDWGYFYVAAPKEDKIVQYISTAAQAIESYRKGSTSTSKTNGTSLSLNTIIPFGQVGNAEVERFVELGYDELYAIQYFKTNLRPWWNNSGKETMENQLTLAANEYKEVIAKCERFDNELYAESLKSGGEKYAHLNVLAYRQSIAAHTLVKSPNDELLWLSKENNSGGFINTVDVTYPSAPLYLLYNPELLKGMLTGIFYFSESGKYPYPWAAHDLGTYPHANGQTYGEPMPVEESGNMIILTAAITKVQGNATYARRHWKTLTTWAEYLVKEGFDPKEQLCTDDFAGHLARNINLSVKAIVGIASYAQMADVLGEKATAQKYRTIAHEMVQKWIEMAGAGDHYALTFDDKNTWSLKYNLVWDKVLDLKLFPQHVYDTEIEYYLKKTKKFGVPLDSRKAYTKNDWILWTATFAPTRQQFDALINPVYVFSLEAPTRVPLNDFYDADTGVRENFKARSVVGGFFMKTLADRMAKK